MELPHPKANDEAYALTVDVEKEEILLQAPKHAGIFYAIQTLLALLDFDTLTLPAVDVYDAPRFPYRGVMLDVSRNFRGKEEILKVLDTMAMYKMNVFHFHLVDDQGWRLEIPGLEELTEVNLIQWNLSSKSPLIPLLLLHVLP